MSDQEDLNRLAIQAQLLQREGEALSGQLEMMQTAITDLNATIDTLKNLKEAKEKGLLPIGSGAYITCKDIDESAVLLSIGGGMIVKKKVADAVEVLDKRQKNASEAFEKAQKNMASINQHLQDLNSRASVLAARLENVQSP